MSQIHSRFLCRVCHIRPTLLMRSIILSLFAVTVSANGAPQSARLAAPLAAPPAAPIESATASVIYRYAGECVVLRDNETDQFVVNNGFRYVMTSDAKDATPFRMQATDLGSYLLYGPDSKMVATGNNDRVVTTASANPKADWELSKEAQGFQFTSIATEMNLSVAALGRVQQSSQPSPRWDLVLVNDCATFPEIEVNVSGVPMTGTGSSVKGFADVHVHVTAFEFLGGDFHCGRPWSRYGAEDALRDCPDHAANGVFAIAENLLSTGSPTGTHSNDGWPNFGTPELQGWPRHDSLTHEGTYWKGIERAWRSGLRIMVVDLVENRALCELYWLGHNDCTDMASITLQAKKLRDMQDYIDAQSKGPGRGFFRIVTSPAEARTVINDGKLAVVIGVETSQPFDCLYQDGVELCSEEQIDQGLQQMWDLGVRSLFPIHKFDSAFGGTAMDGGTQGILVNLGNKYITGRWWQVEECTGDESDRTPVSIASGAQQLELDPNQRVFREEFTAPLEGDDLPIYPPGPVCNVRGLTPLGEYLINRMIDIGMIIESDHLSAKARDRALDIMEERKYSGVITSHSWGGAASQKRIQALGGIVAPYARSTNRYIESWQEAREHQSPDYLWGIAYGTDTNGLGAQAAPRPGAVDNNPVTYPFENFDGDIIVEQSHWGNRVWDFNLDGASHYGLFADWVEDMRRVAGPDIVTDLANGAEAYLQMWERTYPSDTQQTNADQASSD